MVRANNWSLVSKRTSVSRVAAIALLLGLVSWAWAQEKLRGYTNPSAGFAVRYPAQWSMMTGPPPRVLGPARTFGVTGNQFFLAVEESGPFMILTTETLAADASLKGFALQSWGEFAKTRASILNHTEAVQQNPTVMKLDFREKLDGEEWVGRAFFAVNQPKKLGYRFCSYARPAEVEKVAPAFEKIVTTCQIQNWQPLGRVDAHGSIVDLATLDGTTLVTVGTAHGMASVALNGADLKRLIRLLNGDKPSKLTAEIKTGVLASVIEVESWRGGKRTLFFREDGGILEGGRMEPAIFDAKAMQAFQARLKQAAGGA